MSLYQSAVSGRVQSNWNQNRSKRAAKLIRGAAAVSCESLEDRRMFNLTSGVISTLYTTAGNSWTYQALNSSMGVLGTVTYHALGEQSVDGISGSELDTTTTVTSGANTYVFSVKDFFTSSDSGFIDNGSITSDTANGVVRSTSKDTFSPGKILLPASMVFGQTYPVSYTQTETNNISGGALTTTVETVQETFSLDQPSAQSITVPAGTFNASLVDVTTITTPQGGTATTDQEEDYFAAGAGLVKSVVGPLSAATEYVELQSSSLTGGGGGGGGGVAGTGITPTIVSTTVPSAVVGGAKLHSAIKLTLTDSESTAEKGYTVKVYASPTTTLDTSVDKLVTSVTKPSTIKSGKSAPLSVPITGLPSSLPDGSYYLIAQTTDAAGNTDSVSTASPVVVAAPFVALSETVATTLPTALVSGTAAKGTVTLEITNSGNVASKGLTPINVTASTVSGVLGTSIATLSKVLNILPGKTMKVVVPVKSTPALADGSYFLVAQTTDPLAGGTSIASSAGTITVAAPFITLVGVLGPVTKLKAGDTLTVTNNGNIAETGILTAAIGFSTDAAGASPVGGTLSAGHSFHILPGKSVKVKSNDWIKLVGGLTAGVPYYLTVTVRDSTGHSALAVSPDTFTL